MTDWKNKKVAILGLGVEGLSSARFLQEKGAGIWILDRKKKEHLDKDFLTQAEALNSTFILGEDYLKNLSQFDVIVRSPGVRRNTEELLAAEKDGVIITSQIKLFFDYCPSKIIGVTGTKGKGTTSSLIYEMLKQSGREAYLGGNIGLPPLEFIDKLTGSSWVVLELSSFQLQDLTKSPHIGVMLMVTSEHLDHHATVDEYISAKRNLFRFQTSEDFAVINRDYPASHESDIETQGSIFYVSRERETDNACFAVGDTVIIRRNGNDEKIIKTAEVALPGRHNLENVCAATMAAKLAGISIKDIVEVLKSFTGLEHRLQLVAEVNGVKYYDDSFSTTPETAIAAIESFKEPEILILGGSSKNSDFTELGKTIRNAENIKAIIGIGEEWDVIKEKIGTLASPVLLIEGATTMEQIVQAATKIAKKGDIVLLSPGCASFDMFKNYKERAESFIRQVKLISSS